MRGECVMKVIFSCCVLALAFGAANLTALAQKETPTGVETEKDLALLRRDLRADKKQLIALNLPLTTDEATKFWPVYDQYVADITKVYDQFYAVIKEFAAKQKTISDAEAHDLTKQWSALLIQLAQTRQKWVPVIEGVIPARKAALFFHVDRRLYSLIELQVVSETPLLAH